MWVKCAWLTLTVSSHPSHAQAPNSTLPSCVSVQDDQPSLNVSCYLRLKINLKFLCFVFPISWFLPAHRPWTNKQTPCHGENQLEVSGRNPSADLTRRSVAHSAKNGYPPATNITPTPLSGTRPIQLWGQLVGTQPGCTVTTAHSLRGGSTKPRRGSCKWTITWIQKRKKHEMKNSSIYSSSKSCL